MGVTGTSTCVLGPIIDIFKPLMSGNMVYGYWWAYWSLLGFSFGYNGSAKQIGYFGTPERIAAYEEIWRREEGVLWDWLEERVGAERMHG